MKNLEKIVLSYMRYFCELLLQFITFWLVIAFFMIEIMFFFKLVSFN